MKRCPECRRDYFDDTLLYCLEDGAALVQGSVPLTAGGSDEPATAILHGAAPAESPTRTQMHTDEETPVLPSGIAADPKAKGFDKRLMLAPIALAVIVLGGFVAYRYLMPADDQIRSIAVLPFRNKSGDPSFEYLSDGLAESLVYRLSQLPDLKVSPTSSVIQYKEKDTPVAAIASELGVDAVMTGRVAQIGDNLTISVELVDVRNNRLLWGEQYERKMSELLATQREIAATITQKLQLKLSGDETGLTKKYTNDNEAYQLYLKGRYHTTKRTKPDLERAVDYYRQALARDANFALAHVGVADAYNAMPPYGYMKPRDSFPVAKAAALRALEIDPTLADAHSAYGVVLGAFEWKWEEAERHHKKAIELEPNRESPHYNYALAFLAFVGRAEEAVAEMKQALEIEPLSLNSNARLATAYGFAGQDDLSLEQARRATDLDPNFVGGMTALAEALIRAGRFSEAIAIAERGINTYPKQPQLLSSLGLAYAKAGRRDAAKQILDDLERRSATENVLPARAARIWVALGETDHALRWLEKAYEERDWFFTLANLDRNFDEVRGNARFKEILSRSGIKVR